MPDGSSALFAAAAMNKLTVVKYLLAAGADKDWGTEQFQTAGFRPVFFWHGDFRNDGCHGVLNDGLMMFNGEIGAIGGHTHYYIPWLRVVPIVLVKSRCSRFVAKS